MFTFEDAFARAVFVMVVCGYILDWLFFRFIYILIFALYKYFIAKKHGYFNSKGIYSESEVEVALRVEKLLEAKKLKRNTEKEQNRLKDEQNTFNEDGPIMTSRALVKRNHLGEIEEEDEPEESLSSCSDVLRNTNIEKRVKKKAKIEVTTLNTPKSQELKVKDSPSQKVKSPKNVASKKINKKKKSPRSKNKKGKSPKKFIEPKISFPSATSSVSDSPDSDGKNSRPSMISPDIRASLNIRDLNKPFSPELPLSPQLKDEDLPKLSMANYNSNLTEEQQNKEEDKPKIERKDSLTSFQLQKSLSIDVNPQLKKPSNFRRKVRKSSKRKTSNPQNGQKINNPAGGNVHKQFRKSNKSQAKGDRKLSHHQAKNNAIEEIPDLENQEDVDNQEDLETAYLDTKGRLFSNRMSNQGRLSGRWDDSSYESDSSMEMPPTCLLKLTDEEDVRILEKNHPNVLEDIQEHTLFLLRAIFDAYDTKGDKITKYFRSNKLSKSLQVKAIELLECPEELLEEAGDSDSNILDSNKADTNDPNLFGGKNQDLSVINSNPDNSELNGFDSKNGIDKDKLNQLGQSTDELNGDKNGINGNTGFDVGLVGFYGDNDLSECTHHTPLAIDDTTVVFDKGDGINKPLDVDLSDSFDGLENDMVMYEKEDITNYSKGYRLNWVKQRELPAFGQIPSETGTPTSRGTSKMKNSLNKKKNQRNSKLDQIFGVYENEPRNSIRDRNKAFGYVGISGKDKHLSPKAANNRGLGGKGKRGGSKGRSDTDNTLLGSKIKRGKDRFGNRSTMSDNGARLGFNSMSPNDRNKRGRSNDDSNTTNNLNKKLKKRRKDMKKKTVDDRNRKFKALDIDSKHMRDKANLAKRKAHKRIAKRAIDYTFFLDFDSPYAEYLPALYKEWQPKDPKKTENNNAQPETSKIGDKLNEVSHVYKHEGRNSENSSVLPSRRGPRKPIKKSKFSTGSITERTNFNAVHLNPKNRLPKRISSKKTNKSLLRGSKKSQNRMPIILDNFDESIALGSDNDPLKISYPKDCKIPTRFTQDIKLKGLENSLNQSEEVADLMSPEIVVENVSEASSIGPLFKGKKTQKAGNSSKNSLSDSHELPMRIGQQMRTFNGNFMTGEGIFDKSKESELSSNDIEILEDNLPDHYEQSSAT